MSQAIDNIFSIMRVINASNTALTAHEISQQTWLSDITVKRHAKRLYKEGLIAIQQNAGERKYRYSKIKDKNKDKNHERTN